MWVVVGLGNPGRRYQRSRHNAGFRVLDRLAARWEATAAREAHRALVGEAWRGGERVLLVKPQTYMNASGDAVASLRRFYRFEPARLIAIHDDVDLPAGRIRIRAAGGAGGNRGVESLLEAIGDQGFVRVRVGVGRPPAGPVPADYVLGVATGEEAAVLDAGEAQAADAVELILSAGPERAMNRFNQREAPHGGSPL